MYVEVVASQSSVYLIIGLSICLARGVAYGGRVGAWLKAGRQATIKRSEIVDYKTDSLNF